MERKHSKNITRKEGLTMTKDRIPKDTPRGKRLEFTCPKCGGHRLVEVVVRVQERLAVYDPVAPDYVWDPKWDKQILIEWGYGCMMPDVNHYRCYDCKTELLDEDGNRDWGGDFLLEWLKAHAAATQDEGASPDQGSR
jgi:DNA-directed RNA polymerase subunit RPC12/RpoP